MRDSGSDEDECKDDWLEEETSVEEEEEDTRRSI